MWHKVVGIMALKFEKPSSNLHVYNNIEKKGLEVPFKRTGLHWLIPYLIK
jgi:hypothetical protein